MKNLIIAEVLAIEKGHTFSATSENINSLSGYSGGENTIKFHLFIPLHHFKVSTGTALYDINSVLVKIR